MDLRIRDRRADRDRPILKCRSGRPHGRFGRPIGIEEAASATPTLGQHLRTRFTRDDDGAQIGHVVGRQRGEGGRRQRDLRDAPLAEQVGKRRAGQQRVARGEVQRGARGEGHYNLEKRRVEAQRGELKDSDSRRRSEDRGLRPREIEQPRCSTITPFGLPVEPEV